MTGVDASLRHGFLRHGGTLGRLTAAFDWSATPLGPIDEWDAVLRDAVALILHSDVPMVLLWGADGIMLYNDAYSVFAGGRHPASLGSKVRESWPEIADFNDHVVRTMLAGQTLRYERQELTVARDGAPETVWLDLDYSPVVDAAGVPRGGLVLVHDVTHRVLAKRQAEEGREQFRILTQAMPNQVWSASPDGALDWFNDQVYAYTGAAAGTLKDATWSGVLHPDDIENALAAWRAALAGGETYETEFRLRRHDGAYLWHLARALPIRDERGTIVRWIGTTTDIDERKRSEARYARDRDRLWRLSRDLMMVAEMSGVITAVNPTAERLLGWTEDELVGRHLRELIHPDDIGATIAEAERLAGGAASSAFVNRYRTKSGDYRTLDWTAVPDAGRIHAVARDITEERRLTRDRERVWTLSPVIQMVVRGDGEILGANPRWTQALGWTLAETAGANVRDFVVDGQRDQMAARLVALDGDSPALEREWRVRTKDGRVRRLMWVTVKEGDTLYSFGRDVTEAAEQAEALAAAEEALRQAQKMEAVGQLTGGIAHDFNNLLQGITGSLETVRRRIEQGRTADLERFIHGAAGAAERAAALTHRLLAFSRRQPLDPRPVAGNPLIAAMADLLRRALGERIELTLDLAPDLWRTLCDPHQLENAVLNLAINARDAMPGGGRLVIATDNAPLDDSDAALERGVTPGQYIRITVRDTGVGMPPETIARAFEPFFTTKPIGQGTGLGLSMIYGFARQSEGFARIESEVGRGTTVRLYLPRSLAAPETEVAAPAGTPDTRTAARETILVVEDEPVVRALVVEELGELGYRTLAAADGTAALALLGSDARIDLLVTDMGLPDLNGREVAQAARAARPGLRVLFMTGYAETAALAAGFLEEGMALITKPFPMRAFAARIRAILEDAG